MIAEFMDPAILGFILVGVMLFAIFVGFPNFIHFNFFRFCIWLPRFWKISFLSNDTPIFHGNDRTNSRCCSALCFYGNNDGTGWINGKTILCFPAIVS